MSIRYSYVPADDETAVVPRELRAVEGLQHLDFLLDVVQVILGGLQLYHLCRTARAR